MSHPDESPFGFRPTSVAKVDAWVQQLRSAGWRATAKEWEARFADRLHTYLTIHVYDTESGEGWELTKRQHVANLLNKRDKRFSPW